jgi:3-deoxy-D-manno-octulosonic-acid transferase/heptosyltransferase-1
MSAIGDVVHALPFLEVLKKRFPEAQIDWLVEEEAGQIIEGHPALHQVIASRRKVWQSRIFGRASEFSSVIGEVVRFVRKVRSTRYDLVIDLQGLLRSGILTGLARGVRKLGMEGAREGAWLFLNERPVPVNYEQHAIERYLQVARHLGCDIESWRGDIPISAHDRIHVSSLVGEKQERMKPMIAVNPMARWRTKLWETDRFARLADRLIKELSCDVVFTGGPSDKRIIDEIAAMTVGPIANLAGRTTLKELAFLYSQCRALVTTDTGPMHIGAAMGCPVVALFGPTAPLRTGPYGRGHTLIQTNLACSPCFRKKCEDVQCMREITVEQVFRAVAEKLEKNSQSQRAVGSP